jgi:geranylgeranyl reductase family protein
MINIIGAGPAGCYAAYLLAKAGRKVQVFEEHKEIGKPVQCTGIVTSEFEDVMEPKKEFTLNKTNKVRINSISGKCLELKHRKDNFILDRAKFDSYLAKKAEKAGARFFLGAKFLKGNKDFFVIKHKDKEKKIEKGTLIGADGPLSNVAKSYGFYTKMKMTFGFQYRVCLDNDNFIEFYPGIGIYLWIVPEGNGICRIGIVDYLGKNIRKKLDFFMKKKGINKRNIIDYQGGLIPSYHSRIKIEKRGVFLIGDAASQVKATTGGGIVPGLIAAKGLADAIVNKGDYKSNIRKLRKELFIHLIVRHALDNFKKKDWNYLFKLFENKKNNEILSTIERERISRLVIPLLRNDPRFLYFVKRVFF